MIAVKRLAEPAILAEKKAEWQTKYDEKRAANPKARPESKQYAHRQVVEALEAMSHRKCFYCEAEGKMTVDHYIEVAERGDLAQNEHGATLPGSTRRPIMVIERSTRPPGRRIAREPWPPSGWQRGAPTLPRGSGPTSTPVLPPNLTESLKRPWCPRFSVIRHHPSKKERPPRTHHETRAGRATLVGHPLSREQVHRAGRALCDLGVRLADPPNGLRLPAALTLFG